MASGNIHYKGVVTVPFSMLKNDPLLILKNLPRVDTIEKIADMDYRVTLKPFVLHSALDVVAVGHVTLQVFEDRIEWIHSPNYNHEDCNGVIIGVAKPALDTNATFVEGDIELQHRFINNITWSIMKPVFEKIGQMFINEFNTNFHNPDFSNQIPEA